MTISVARSDHQLSDPASTSGSKIQLRLSADESTPPPLFMFLRYEHWTDYLEHTVLLDIKICLKILSVNNLLPVKIVLYIRPPYICTVCPGCVRAYAGPGLPGNNDTLSLDN